MDRNATRSGGNRNRRRRNRFYGAALRGTVAFAAGVTTYGVFLIKWGQTPLGWELIILPWLTLGGLYLGYMKSGLLNGNAPPPLAYIPDRNLSLSERIADWLFPFEPGDTSQGMVEMERLVQGPSGPGGEATDGGLEAAAGEGAPNLPSSSSTPGAGRGGEREIAAQERGEIRPASTSISMQDMVSISNRGVHGRLVHEPNGLGEEATGGGSAADDGAPGLPSSSGEREGKDEMADQEGEGGEVQPESTSMEEVASISNRGVHERPVQEPSGLGGASGGGSSAADADDGAQGLPSSSTAGGGCEGGDKKAMHEDGDAIQHASTSMEEMASISIRGDHERPVQEPSGLGGEAIGGDSVESDAEGTPSGSGSVQQEQQEISARRSAVEEGMVVDILVNMALGSEETS